MDVCDFVVIASKNASAIANTCRMLRNVRYVEELANGNVLVMLDQPVRDDDRFARIEGAVLALNGVTGVDKIAADVFGERTKYDMVGKLFEVVEELKPVPPIDGGDCTEFIKGMRAWLQVRAAVATALQQMR